MVGKSFGRTKATWLARVGVASTRSISRLLGPQLALESDEICPLRCTHPQAAAGLESDEIWPLRYTYPQAAAGLDSDELPQ